MITKNNIGYAILILYYIAWVLVAVNSGSVFQLVGVVMMPFFFIPGIILTNLLALNATALIDVAILAIAFYLITRE